MINVTGLLCTNSRKLSYGSFCLSQSPIEPLLPQLLNQTSSRNKSARSTGSFLLEDGQLALPKTFVTRKGAIILFTPSEDLCHHGNRESHLNKENVYEAGLKLRTLGNLTNSVLEFGKEVRLLSFMFCAFCVFCVLLNFKALLKVQRNSNFFNP